MDVKLEKQIDLEKVVTEEVPTEAPQEDLQVPKINSSDVGFAPGVQRTNQASATGEDSVPVAFSSQHSRKRNIIVLSVVGVTAALIAPGAWILAKNSSANNFPAEVSSFGLVPVNFSGSGQVSSLDVKPGDVVKSGQILGTETNPVSNVAVVHDQQILAADQARLSALQALQTSIAANDNSSQASTNASVAANIGAAATALRQIQASFDGELAKAQSNLAFTQAALTQAQAVFAGQCPNGTNAAGPTLSLAECIAEQNAVVGLQQTVNSESENVLAIQANQQQANGIAQRSLSDAQNQGLIQGAMGSASALEQGNIISAQADVTKDRAQLLADQAQQGSLILRAPVAGRIVQLNGALGDEVGSSGVLVSTAQASSVPVPKSTQLFSNSGLTQNSSASSVPLLLMRTSQPLRISALIPQGKLNTIHVGQTAEFISSVSGLPNLELKITQIGGFSVVANGIASYPVTLALKSGNTQGYLQGITGTVKF